MITQSVDNIVVATDTAFIKAIHLNHSGSVVEHCIISDYENKNSSTSAIHLSGEGTIRYTIANQLTSDANGVFYSNTIQSCFILEILGLP